MRKQGKMTLSETMGSHAGNKGSKITLGDLPDILGERMPKLQYNPLGRVRLIRALSMRFGASFRNLPGINDILEEFEKEHSFEKDIYRMKNIKAKGK